MLEKDVRAQGWVENWWRFGLIGRERIGPDVT
jgi:hypothetical protein